MTTDDLIWKAREVVSWVQKHFLSLRGGTVTGPVTFKDDVTSTYLDNRYVNVTGDTMTGLLEVSREGDNVPALLVTVYDTSGAVAASQIIVRAARGTSTSPSALQTNDLLLGSVGRGYGATGFSSGARAGIAAYAAENWTDAAQGTYLVFLTTATGGVSVSEKMRISPTGDVGINETVPNAKLDVNGTTRLGDSDTNYFGVSATGDVTLAGSAKYERHVQIDAKANGTVANQPSQVDFFTAGGLQFASVGAKYAYCQWEVPDDWDGTDVVFEIDWFPDSGATSGTDAVRWTVEYRAIAEGEPINNGTSVTLDNGVGGDTADYSQYQTKHSRFTLAYNNANQPLTAQDHVYFKISRDTSVANDFAGTVTVTAYEIIYQSKGFPTSN